MAYSILWAPMRLEKAAGTFTTCPPPSAIQPIMSCLAKANHAFTSVRLLALVVKRVSGMIVAAGIASRARLQHMNPLQLPLVVDTQVDVRRPESDRILSSLESSQ